MTDHVTATVEELLAKRDDLTQLITALERYAGTGRRDDVKPKRPVARKRKPSRSKTVKVSATSRSHLAAWRDEITRQLKVHPRGSKERTDAIGNLVGTKVKRPDGKLQTITRATLYLWLQHAEGTIGQGHKKERCV